MSLSLCLTKARRWLRAGYHVGAPHHGYVPLIALMAAPAVQTEDPPNAAERPMLLIVSDPAGDAVPEPG